MKIQIGAAAPKKIDVDPVAMNVEIGEAQKKREVVVFIGNNFELGRLGDKAPRFRRPTICTIAETGSLRIKRYSLIRHLVAGVVAANKRGVPFYACVQPYSPCIETSKIARAIRDLGDNRAYVCEVSRQKTGNHNHTLRFTGEVIGEGWTTLASAKQVQRREKRLNVVVLWGGSKGSLQSFLLKKNLTLTLFPFCNQGWVVRDGEMVYGVNETVMEALLQWTRHQIRALEGEKVGTYCVIVANKIYIGTSSSSQSHIEPQNTRGLSREP